MKFYSAQYRCIVWGSLIACHRNWPWLTCQRWKGWALGSSKDAGGRNLWMISARSSRREESCLGKRVWLAHITSCVHPFARWGRGHLTDPWPGDGWFPKRRAECCCPKWGEQQCCREEFHPCGPQVFMFVRKSVLYSYSYSYSYL